MYAYPFTKYDRLLFFEGLISCALKVEAGKVVLTRYPSGHFNRLKKRFISDLPALLGLDYIHQTITF
jgi:hypothetical protein